MVEATRRRSARLEGFADLIEVPYSNFLDDAEYTNKIVSLIVQGKVSEVPVDLTGISGLEAFTLPDPNEEYPFPIIEFNVAGKVRGEEQSFFVNTADSSGLWPLYVAPILEPPPQVHLDSLIDPNPRYLKDAGGLLPEGLANLESDFGDLRYYFKPPYVVRMLVPYPVARRGEYETGLFAYMRRREEDRQVDGGRRIYTAYSIADFETSRQLSKSRLVLTGELGSTIVSGSETRHMGIMLMPHILGTAEVEDTTTVPAGEDWGIAPASQRRTIITPEEGGQPFVYAVQFIPVASEV